MAGGLFDGLNSFLFGSDEYQAGEVEARNHQVQADQLAEQYRQREYQDYVRQQQLYQYLNRVISGQAPSVAGTQLTIGQDQGQRAMASQAAGATGVNAGLAGYGAILGTGRLNAETNQQAALLRADETAKAVAAQGNIGANMGARSAALGTAATTNGLDYSKLGYGIDQAQQDQRNKENGAVMTGLGDAAAMYFGGAGGLGARKLNQYGGEQMDYTPAKV